MPAQSGDDFWDEDQQLSNNGDAKPKPKSTSVPLRPPLYNAEDYITALKQLFSSHCHPHAQRHPGSVQTSQKNRPDAAVTPPEMSMRKFLNGSELLFKLEADLRHAYPTFVQEFVSVHCEGVLHTLEALKLIQAALDEVTGLREQRKVLMDEQKCLQCLRLCLRNIESVSKLSTYPGGLYPIAAAMVSTVTATRIVALEILTCICSEGGAEGHFKVSEAISTLRLRVGEPIRCKLLIGALSSAAPGVFQAKGVRFLATWVASAPSPRHKVHIQCELEEAGFSPGALRKGSEIGGAREARLVQTELDNWDRVAIDVDTLTRQNSQLRNSVATLQQELATLKDKLKRMDPYPSHLDDGRRRTVKSPPKRNDDIASTPVDSEEEAEQIHQLLEDLNNIVNSELDRSQESTKTHQRLESDIVPMPLVKSPPKKGPMSPLQLTPRPWPGSSASDDDDESDLVKTPSPKMATKQETTVGPNRNNVEATNPKQYLKNGLRERSTFGNPNFIVGKFPNFKTSLYASTPDTTCVSGIPVALNQSQNSSRMVLSKGLRRSESLHTSLASIQPPTGFCLRDTKAMKPTGGQLRPAGQTMIADKWKSVDDLDVNDNFTLRWKYPSTDVKQEVKPVGTKGGRIMELFNDYRQNRFSKGGDGTGSRGSSGSPMSTSIFGKSKGSKKSAQNEKDTKMFSLPPIFVSQGVDLMNHRICDLPSGLY